MGVGVSSYQRMRMAVSYYARLIEALVMQTPIPTRSLASATTTCRRPLPFSLMYGEEGRVGGRRQYEINARLLISWMIVVLVPWPSTDYSVGLQASWCRQPDIRINTLLSRYYFTIGYPYPVIHSHPYFKLMLHFCILCTIALLQPQELSSTPTA